MAIVSTSDQEQALIRDVFGAAAQGYFVETGLNHPTEGSQTWPLEQAGWTGVLVEPQPNLAAFLVTSRNARVFAAACSSPDNAGTMLPLRVAGPANAEEAYSIAAPARTLDGILDEAAAPVPVDFLCVNAGGNAAEILRGFDFGRWQPLLVAVNDPVDTLATHSALKRNGYRLVRRLGGRGWYVPEEQNAAVPLAARWQILRSYYLALPLRKIGNAFRRVKWLYANWWAGR